ncbi:MAG TPA: hypothetical protein VEX64_07245, partial [Pyrinomonadaceae bacterium]|nr:hypothetical protein [Pyrinomonadaceae bacterium]
MSPNGNTTTNTAEPVAAANKTTPENEPPEVLEAKKLALRYRLPYVDLHPSEGKSPIDFELLATLPVDLMLKNHFVPLQRVGRNLHLAMADPTNL